MSDFIIPTGPDFPTLPNKYNIILSTFGLANIKPKLFNLPNEEEQDEAFAISYLGTPVYSNLIINKGSYTDDNGKVISYNGLDVDTVLFDVFMDKNIIKTVLQGRNGSVKEYISDGDFEVIIRGALVSKEANKYPAQEFDTLKTICKLPVAIEVYSGFLQFMSIHNLVIHSYNFPQREGFNNMQVFELRCMSDEPIELSL